MDLMLVPLGFLVMIGYHVWLWHQVRTQPLSTIIGTNAHARRFWVSAMIKARTSHLSIPININRAKSLYYILNLSKQIVYIITKYISTITTS